jgi:hypothetical protein
MGWSELTTNKKYTAPYRDKDLEAKTPKHALRDENRADHLA